MSEPNNVVIGGVAYRRVFGWWTAHRWSQGYLPGCYATLEAAQTAVANVPVESLAKIAEHTSNRGEPITVYNLIGRDRP